MDVSENLCDVEHSFFFEIMEGCKVSCIKNILLADLLGSQHLFEILQTSITVKNSEKWIFRETLAMVSDKLFFEMKEGYKVCCVKTLIFF